jgi:hypothetical protein
MNPNASEIKGNGLVRFYSWGQVRSSWCHSELVTEEEILVALL